MSTPTISPRTVSSGRLFSLIWSLAFTAGVGLRFGYQRNVARKRQHNCWTRNSRHAGGSDVTGTRVFAARDWPRQSVRAPGQRVAFCAGLKQAEQLQDDDDHNDNSDDIEDVSVHKLRVLAVQPHDGEMFRHRFFPEAQPGCRRLI